MKNLLRVLGGVASFAFLNIAAQAQVVVMQPLSTFGTNGDGSVRPAGGTFLTSTNEWQRGVAYNPTTGHLLFIDRSTNSPTTPDIYVLDGNTGAAITNADGSFFKLANSPLTGGGSASFPLSLIGVADDGAIYAGNLTSSTAANFPQYHLYRWATETSGLTIVFPDEANPAAFGDPGNGNTNSLEKRWGDTMSVRGSGLDTQVLIANRGTLAAVFTPVDSNMAVFIARTLNTTLANGALGIGLTFGAGNTFWGTAGATANGPLVHLQFNTNTATATTLATFPTSSFPGTISPILVMPSSNLLAGITTVAGADVVRLYDISNSNSPVLLDKKSFATSHNNGTFSGALALGTNGVLYALDSDNGIMAFTLTSVSTNPLIASFYQNPSSQTLLVGTNATFTAFADGNGPITYQWFYNTNTIIAGATNTSLTLTNLQLTNSGGYSVVASGPFNTTTSSVATLTVSSILPGTLLVYDPFAYAVGSPLVTDTTGQGTWLIQTAGQVSGTNVAGNLNVPGLAASVSNHLFWGSATIGMRSVIASPTISTGTIYFSFAYMLEPGSTVPAAGANGSTVAGLAQTTTTTTYSYKVHVHTNATGPGYNVGAFKLGSEAYGGFATNVIALGDTVFIVGRYTFNDAVSADDTIALWVNPDPSTFGAATSPIPSMADGGIVQIVGTQPFTTEPSIGRFAFRQSAGPSRSHADEVRVGRSWADVTPPAPVVAAPPKLSVALSNSTAIISWPTSATGFNLEGAANLNSPISWAPVANPVTVVGTNNTVAVSATSGNQFFRLKK